MNTQEFPVSSLPQILLAIAYAALALRYLVLAMQALTA